MENKLILLVEDNPRDEVLTLRALKKSKIANSVVVARDGVEALDYLFGRGAYADPASHVLPQLVLLDLKLPFVMGLDVLAWIREQSELKSTIVIVLTSSRHTEDIRMAYQLGANAYLVKPADLDALEEMMRTLKGFWLTQNVPSPDCGKWAVRESAKA